MFLLTTFSLSRPPSPLVDWLILQSDRISQLVLWFFLFKREAPKGLLRKKENLFFPLKSAWHVFKDVKRACILQCFISGKEWETCISTRCVTIKSFKLITICKEANPLLNPSLIQGVSKFGCKSNLHWSRFFEKGEKDFFCKNWFLRMVLLWGGVGCCSVVL